MAYRRGTLTRLGTLGLVLWFLASSTVPGCAVATDEAGDSLGVDVLAIDPEGRLFALGGPLLLLAKHQVDLLGLDVLADMPCGETILVLLFSGQRLEDPRDSGRGTVRGKELIIPLHDAFDIP